MAEEVIVLQGNLGGDSVMRFTPSGQAVINFNMATNKVWKDKNGVTQTRTKWWTVTVWGNYAEALHPHLKKGKPVFVVASMNEDKETHGPRVFQRQDGTYGAKYEVTASTVNFIGGAGNGDSQQSQTDYQDEIVEDDSVPFNI